MRKLKDCNIHALEYCLSLFAEHNNWIELECEYSGAIVNLADAYVRGYLTGGNFELTPINVKIVNDGDKLEFFIFRKAIMEVNDGSRNLSCYRD